ncbi:membrane bound O-acyl transferase family-domain-containing protein [Panaeolus papilionaceus]|nr:membrane bound O-acyl transferase family-domain-containing protein [Panaeolus papilionaceus]
MLELLVFAIYALSLTVKPTNPYRRSLFFLILCVTLYGILGAGKAQLETYWVAHSRGCGFGAMLLLSSTDILLCNPQKEFRPIPKPPKPISEQSFLSRLRWALNLAYNYRGVNFEHGSQNNLRMLPKSTTNTAFILRQIRRIIIFTIVWEVGTLVAIYNPFLQRLVDPSGITGVRGLWRLGFTLHWMHILAAISIGQAIFSIVGVLTGLTHNSDWPDLFGSIVESHTLRRFWGTYWHQTFRRAFLMHANFFASKLGLPPTGLLQRYFKVFVSFFLSALFHWAGEIVASGGIWSIGALEFFLLQGLMITIEDGVLYTFRCVGFRATRWTKMMGYVWVFLWFNWSLPYWIDIQYRNGILGEVTIPISPLQKYLTGRWRPAPPVGFN